MDVVCDTLMVEEILPRLLPKWLLRLAATSRRYNALARCPDFAARYWQRTGVFFLPLQKPVEFAPRFLTSPPTPGALSTPRSLRLLPPIFGQSGTSYWMSYGKDQALAYNNAAGGGATGSIRVITLPDGLVHGRWNRCIGERHGGGLRYVHSDPWVLEVWDSSSQGQSGRDWTLAHRIGVAELMERNPEAAAFLRDKSPSHWSYHHVKLIGIHPTDDDDTEPDLANKINSPCQSHTSSL